MAWQQLSADDIVDDFIEFGLAWLDDRRYALTIDSDMARWAAAIAASGEGAFVNPAFDPRSSRLSPANSFWLEVRAGSRTIATCATRLFAAADCLELLRSLRLWLAEPPPGVAVPDFALPRDAPRLCGNIGHEGGLWVDPLHRKRGLSMMLPHLARALAAREWPLDWQTGIARQAIGECGIARWAYGMPHVERCFDGYFPLTLSRERLYLCYMSRAELLAGLDPHAVARLLADRHQQPRHAPALVMEG